MSTKDGLNGAATGRNDEWARQVNLKKSERLNRTIAFDRTWKYKTTGANAVRGLSQLKL